MADKYTSCQYMLAGGSAFSSLSHCPTQGLKTLYSKGILEGQWRPISSVPSCHQCHWKLFCRHRESLVLTECEKPLYIGNTAVVAGNMWLRIAG